MISFTYHEPLQGLVRVGQGLWHVYEGVRNGGPDQVVHGC